MYEIEWLLVTPNCIPCPQEQESLRDLGDARIFAPSIIQWVFKRNILHPWDHCQFSIKTLLSKV